LKIKGAAYILQEVGTEQADDDDDDDDDDVWDQETLNFTRSPIMNIDSSYIHARNTLSLYLYF
jgi:hypothetical protein